MKSNYFLAFGLLLPMVGLAAADTVPTCEIQITMGGCCQIQGRSALNQCAQYLESISGISDVAVTYNTIGAGPLVGSGTISFQADQSAQTQLQTDMSEGGFCGPRPGKSAKLFCR